MDFTLNSENGEPVSLSSLSGKVVVLYFYPKVSHRGHGEEVLKDLSAMS